MAQTTVKQLASEVGIPVERLVSRLTEAGVSATSAEDYLSDDDKLKLLRHLRATESVRSGGSKLGSRKSSVSLRRRSTSELKVNTGRGGSSGRTVSVEVRKRRTYVNRAQQAEEERVRKDLEKQEETQRAEEEKAEAQARAQREEEQRKAAED